MIELKINTVTQPLHIQNYIYLNLYNEIDIRFASATYPEGDFYNPLQKLKSQQTGKSVYFCSSAIKTNLERYIGLYCLASVKGLNFPDLGYVNLGYPESPLGFYDYTVYENTSSSNLDPTGLKVIYNGLANVIPVDGNNVSYPSPTYTEYTTSDSENESVYLTN